MGRKQACVTRPVVLNGIKEEMSSFRMEYSKNAEIKHKHAEIRHEQAKARQKNSEAKLDLLKSVVSKKSGSDY